MYTLYYIVVLYLKIYFRTLFVMLRFYTHSLTIGIYIITYTVYLCCGSILVDDYIILLNCTWNSFEKNAFEYKYK